jgi:hypothetical protein
MIRVVLLGFFLGISIDSFSQTWETNFTGAIGNSEGTISAMVGYDWELWKSKKFAIGVGGRVTSYFGTNQYYITAPAELTSGSTGPGVIFKENIDENIDTFLIKSPQVNSINVFINLRYKFNEKLIIGFNIDAIGFSLGAQKSGNYINGTQTAVENSKPTAFNVLLISDNDRGSLNSELYGKYYLNDTWGIKLGVQFLFTEYTTDTEVQQFPEPNDRFRNKSLLLAFGIVCKL